MSVEEWETYIEEAIAATSDRDGLIESLRVTIRDARGSETGKLWLVTKQGVYDHGVHFVGESEQSATRFTESWAPDSDGYHSWRIDEVPVGVLVSADAAPPTPVNTVGTRK